jgi:hypothetical protein
MNKCAQYSFYVRQHHDGTPWILAEWVSGEDILEGTLGFNLSPGTTLRQAEELASKMREHIRELALTSFLG